MYKSLRSSARLLLPRVEDFQLGVGCIQFLPRLTKVTYFLPYFVPLQNCIQFKELTRANIASIVDT
jgi:hypothetical protein